MRTAGGSSVGVGTRNALSGPSVSVVTVRSRLITLRAFLFLLFCLADIQIADPVSDYPVNILRCSCPAAHPQSASPLEHRAKQANSQRRECDGDFFREMFHAIIARVSYPQSQGSVNNRRLGDKREERPQAVRWEGGTHKAVHKQTSTMGGETTRSDTRTFLPLLLPWVGACGQSFPALIVNTRLQVYS